MFQDHIKSKKHMSALEQKQHKYPDIMKKMSEIKPKYSDESDKPNNGDRLAYRFNQLIKSLINLALNSNNNRLNGIY